MAKMSQPMKEVRDQVKKLILFKKTLKKLNTLLKSSAEAKDIHSVCQELSAMMDGVTAAWKFILDAISKLSIQTSNGVKIIEMDLKEVRLMHSIKPLLKNIHKQLDILVNFDITKAMPTAKKPNYLLEIQSGCNSLKISIQNAEQALIKIIIPLRYQDITVVTQTVTRITPQGDMRDREHQDLQETTHIQIFYGGSLKELYGYSENGNEISFQTLKNLERFPELRRMTQQEFGKFFSGDKNSPSDKGNIPTPKK